MPTSRVIISTLLVWAHPIYTAQKPRQRAPTTLSFSRTLHYIDRCKVQGVLCHHQRCHGDSPIPKQT